MSTAPADPVSVSMMAGNLEYIAKVRQANTWPNPIGIRLVQIHRATCTTLPAAPGTYLVPVTARLAMMAVALESNGKRYNVNYLLCGACLQ